MYSRIVAILVLSLVACSGKDRSADTSATAPPTPPPAIVAAKVPAGALKQMPWLLGTFRGTGAEGTTQAPFYERYSLADDSTLIVESFKDSTLTGAIDTTRYEARRDSLSNGGTARYLATAISADSVTFGPLVGVQNGFTWRNGDAGSWIAVIIPTNANSAKRTYRMARIK
jgi:hypothetical protein